MVLGQTDISAQRPNEEEKLPKWDPAAHVWR